MDKLTVTLYNRSGCELDSIEVKTAKGSNGTATSLALIKEAAKYNIWILQAGDTITIQ